MAGIEFIPNNNQPVTRMLSREFGRYNKGRNRILTGAVCLCILTLTMVFGIASGKVKAEYIKAVRAAGTTASARVEEANASQYEKVRSLNYVTHVGRCVPVGEAHADGKRICSIQVLDEPAWDELVKPAYTDISGHYPEETQELMLSEKVLNDMGIDKPEIGMRISLQVDIGLFRTESEEFLLSGWYTDYAASPSNAGIGYISQAKCLDWGHDIREKSDILLRLSDSMDWQEAEERLYQDIGGNASDLRISTRNPFAYSAVTRLTGGYGMAAFGTLVILCGMFFLIHNVMQISMAGDIRQMGLLNTIGTTKKQIRKIYFGQIMRNLIPGVLSGTLLSAFVLLLLLPEILGNQYLSGYGGSKEFQIFRPEILLAAVAFAVLLTMGASAGVIIHVVNLSCVESMHYTNLERKRRKKEQRMSYRKRSAGGEMWYMAWQNLTRHRGRFLLTVFSLFLGMEAFLGTVVITKGSDYVHVIEQHPDFLIAGQFSAWGQEEGYGNEYRSRDAGEDPMETEGRMLHLLYGNDYDEFSPISPEVRESLLSLDGVKRETSYAMEGAYVISTISRKGVRPLLDDYNKDAAVKEGVGYSEEYEMVEGFEEDVIQILSGEEITVLQQYVEKNNLPVDMENLKDGTGVVILHDHLLSPKQERQAEESVGEPLYFTTMLSKADWEFLNRFSIRELAEMDDAERPKGRDSEIFSLCGYLDNRAEGFPKFRQTWHGPLVYYLISEEGFEKIPTEKKTLYMELDVDEKKEPEIKAEIQNIVSRENRRRAETLGIHPDVGDAEGESGIFCISKSDLLLEAANEIRGSRIVLGSISAVLLFAGLTNYFNVCVMGILSRRRELAVMESVGMTRKQKRMLLAAEGLYYCLIAAVLMLTVGSGILGLIRIYMGKRLSYFVFQYPAGWMLVLAGVLAGICFVVPEVVYWRENKG